MWAGIEWRRPSWMGLVFAVAMALALWGLVAGSMWLVAGRVVGDHWLWLVIVMWGVGSNEIGIDLKKGRAHWIALVTGSTILMLGYVLVRSWVESP